ncbi:MAG TPA: hypothetical protein VMU15_02060 [Anaeromyxobacter sp.]|nr:hypothetical protein [Anaeromyxobacter sp.]
MPRPDLCGAGRFLRLAALVAGLAAGRAAAWSDHALLTWDALDALPELGRAAVVAEPLEAYLADQAPALQGLLGEEEAWSRAHLAGYAPRPADLAFRADGDPATLRQRFLAALRVNPGSRLGLWVRALPGAAGAGRPAVPLPEVTALREDGDLRGTVYLALAPGERVTALEVLATAADEPDRGLDLGLWEDSGTDFGRRSGFGRQPFGNPALEFSSQAPFHMGFYHESWLVYAVAGWLRRTYPEHRIHLYRALSAQALRSGHAYWGWRFAGWALHYLQDLTQPYHARAAPGVGTARQLEIGALDALGVHGPLAAALTLVSNRHLALENYQLHRLRAAVATGREDDALRAALRDASGDRGAPGYDDDAPRARVSREAALAADAVDAAVARCLPHRLVSDPAVTFDDARDPVDLWALSGQAPPPAQRALADEVAGRLRALGRESRSLVRSLPVPGR